MSGFCAAMITVSGHVVTSRVMHGRGFIEYNLLIQGVTSVIKLCVLRLAMSLMPCLHLYFAMC